MATRPLEKLKLHGTHEKRGFEPVSVGHISRGILRDSGKGIAKTAASALAMSLRNEHRPALLFEMSLEQADGALILNGLRHPAGIEALR